MRSSVKAAVLVALAALAAPITASAQVELGVDVGGFLGLNDPGFVEIFTPVDLRAGFPVGASAELEPRLNFSYFKPEGGDGVTNIDAVLGLLWHLKNDPAASRIYIRPFGELIRQSGGTNSLTRFGLGGGIGIKLASSSDLFWRLEAGFSHVFEKDLFPSQDGIFLLLGMSYQER